MKLVKAIEGMDDDTLIKHFNARHMPLGKLTRVRVQFEGEALLRLYHDRLHHAGGENHNHREARQ